MKLKKIFLSILISLGLTIGGDAMAEENVYNFSFTNMDGSKLKLSKYKGKVLLIVNTASQCGFTAQYKELQELYDEYKKQGLVIIAVPSNDFGGQEPGSDKEIKEFCDSHFKITFPLVSKEKIKGDDAHPFYKWAGEQVGFFGTPKWNFHKYLIGHDGKLKEWFSSMTSPNSKSIKEIIEKELKAEG